MDHISRNRRSWNAWAGDYVDNGRRAWGGEPSWGVFHVPDADLGVLPADVTGKDVVELGCGTGYISGWLARRGARPVGIDLSEAQLRSATMFQEEFGPRFPLVHADAEIVPLRASSFDLAVSEYGASIWCDPYRWIPEAARLLRPGGELIFLVNAVLWMLCIPDLEAEGPPTDRLRRDYFEMHRFEWPEDESVNFQLGYGDWIRLLKRNGFEVEALVEVRPGPDATTTWPLITLEWARRWPCEEIWKVRKT